MSKKSKSTLHVFLFHLRTPLATIHSLAALIEKDKTVDTPFPLEGQQWLTKWVPKVEIWLKNAGELTELESKSEVDEYDWKALIQQLLSSLEGVEAAADEGNKILYTDKEMSGYAFHKIITSIEHINDEYKGMQELLPKLD